MDKPYDHDTYGWALEQAERLRRRSANEIDWDNVAEEIESLGKQQAAELRNRYVVLLTHLLKWLHQPKRRSKSWRTTIIVQRDAIADHLDENPSLQPRNADLFQRAYATARKAAASETRLSLETFPEAPPFTAEQACDPDWWPEDPAKDAP